MDEITPPSKRSIRNIPIPAGRRRVSSKSAQEVPQKEIKINKEVKEEIPVELNREISAPAPRIDERHEENIRHDYPSYDDAPEIPVTTPRNRKPHTGGGKKKIIISSVSVLLIIFIFFIISLFTGATVKIYPKKAEAVVNETVTASEMSTNSDSLNYKVVEISETKSKTIKASGEEEVETKASGFITVYNNYSDKEQPLVKKTRFESPDGLIYRIDQSITVPGKSGDTPGSVRVEVFADGTGEEYNTPPTTFTVPGFEGQPQFDGFYAKSTEDINGGFKGVRKVVSEEDMSSAESDLKSELISSLSSKVDEQTSEGFIVIVNDSLFTFSGIKQKESNKDDQVDVELTGTLKAIVIAEGAFSNFIANEALTTFNQSDIVRIDNVGDLEIVFDPESVTDGLDSVTITIKGKANFIWETDDIALKGELAGNNRKELKNILEDFPSISKAEAVIRPFWKRSFPEDLDKITIEEVFE